MLTKSSADLLRLCGRLAGARSPETRGDARVRPVATPGVYRGGDTDALDWRSDPRLLAILDRGAKREREAREGDRFAWRRDGLDQTVHGSVGAARGRRAVAVAVSDERLPARGRVRGLL
jgi:hypothetical protein